MGVNVKSGITNGLRKTSKFILDKEKEYFSILCSDILQKLPPPLPAGMPECRATELLFPVDFRALRASLATQNVQKYTHVNLF
jgi:hypothetical protein